jgi:hypothetical protein
MRETSFVAAQVVTLGVVAMVVGLLALNALAHRPAPQPTAGPSRPLTALVPTLVPDTPTSIGLRTPSPSPTAAPPTATPTAQGLPTERPVPPPTSPPAGAPPPTPADPSGGQPATPTPPPPSAPAAQPTPTVSVSGQMMKVLPASDGLPARVRAEPTTKSPILVRVPIGASVEVLGTANGDELQPGNPRWVKVKWKDVTGYVYSTLVGEG